MKYRFVQIASAARDHCRAGERWVFEDEDSSPVILGPKPLF